MASRSTMPTWPSSQTVITRGGKTHVFKTAEEARAFVSQPLTDEDVAQGLRALEMAEELRQQILARTGGRGITAEDLEDALRAAKEH